jgi:hypothetical protein
LVNRRWLTVFIVAAIVLRAAVRLAGGEETFLADGYTFHITIADTFLAGEGLCYGPGESCAVRPPLYSLFIAGFRSAGWLYPGVVLTQAVMGGAMVWLSWWLGQALFTPGVGMLAAVATAFNPYGVIHDTSLQDTALTNLLWLMALVLLVRAGRANRAGDWLAGGACIGLAVLTSGRVVPVVPAALLWTLLGGTGPWRSRARNAVILMLPMVVVVGGWLVRNWRVVGQPVLTTVSEESLFLANSPLTFVHFPERSIDLTTGEMWRLPADDLRRLDAVEGQGVVRDRVIREMTMAYVTSHPSAVAVGIVRKLWVVASAELSPWREPAVQWGFRLLYLPFHVLSLVAVWRLRHRWRDHAWPWLFVSAFLITTAVYWAHTSHKSLIDPVLFVYGAAGFAMVAPAGRRR